MSVLLQSYNHWFDGMAMLHQFKITEGQVTYMSRFLHSDAYKKNSEHDRIVMSEFGTLAMPDPCKNFFQRFLSRFEMMREYTRIKYNINRLYLMMLLHFKMSPKGSNKKQRFYDTVGVAWSLNERTRRARIQDIFFDICVFVHFLNVWHSRWIFQCYCKL